MCIFSHWRSLARSRIKKARWPALRRIPLRVETLECRLTPAVDMFFTPRAVVAVNPQPLPPIAYVQFDPEVVPTERQTPGPCSSETAVHFQGQLTEVTDPIYMQFTYFCDGSIRGNVIPPGPGSAGSIIASYQVEGMITGTVFVHGSTNVSSWQITATFTFNGTLSAMIHSPIPQDPPQTGMSQEIDGTFLTTTALNQTQTWNGGPAWMALGIVTTTGNFSEICHRPGSCMESLTLQDQVHESLTPMTPAGYGPATKIDAVFTATGNLILVVSFQTDQRGDMTGQLSLPGQMQETVTPPPSPSGPPPTETFTFDLNMDDDHLSAAWENNGPIC